MELKEFVTYMLQKNNILMEDVIDIQEDLVERMGEPAIYCEEDNRYYPTVYDMLKLDIVLRNGSTVVIAEDVPDELVI